MAIANKYDEIIKLEKDLNKEMHLLGKQADQLKHKKEMVANKISKLQKRKLNALVGDDCFSEHATIRYMERIEGKDLSYIKKQVATKEVKKKIIEMKGFGVIDTGPYALVIKGGIVCSIIKPPYFPEGIPDRLQIFKLYP